MTNLVNVGRKGDDIYLHHDTSGQMVYKTDVQTHTWQRYLIIVTMALYLGNGGKEHEVNSRKY